LSKAKPPGSNALGPEPVTSLFRESKKQIRKRFVGPVPVAFKIGFVRQGADKIGNGFVHPLLRTFTSAGSALPEDRCRFFEVNFVSGAGRRDYVLDSAKFPDPLISSSIVG
jgi:hypothetical protein